MGKVKYYIFLLGLCLLGCKNQASKQELESSTGTLSNLNMSFKYDKGSTPLIEDLIDAYNSFNILNSIYNDIELWARFETDVQGVIEKMDCSVIHDNNVKEYASDYKKQVLSSLQDTAVHDSIKWERMEMEYSTLYSKLVNRYHVSQYGELSEEKYWDIYDPTDTIQDYDSIYSLRGTDDPASIAYLKQLMNNAQNFDEKCIYTLEYAHTITEDEYPAIHSLEQLMKSKIYSIYLREIWRTWRCLLQITFGASKDSDIPNDCYNRMRMVCAHTILNHVVQHPNDIMAINQFLILSSEDNINRYGAYPYGNQNMIEEMKLFHEQYDDTSVKP